MLRAKIIILSICIMTTAACGQKNHVSRNNSGILSFAAQEVAGPEQAMLAQARALDDMTREMVRSATLKGAATGAAAGCGLALVTASAADGSNCVVGALAGGGVGAVVGNALGRKRVAERVEIVKLSRVTPAISGAQREMAEFNDGLTELLSFQDTALTELKFQRDTGQITPDAYAAQEAQIREVRVDLAHALSLSAEQARATKLALKNAGEQGQTGLDWHIMSAETLEDEASSARSRISLL